MLRKSWWNIFNEEYIKNLQPDEMIEVIEIFNNVMKLLMQFADVPSNDP